MAHIVFYLTMSLYVFIVASNMDFKGKNQNHGTPQCMQRKWCHSPLVIMIYCLGILLVIYSDNYRYLLKIEFYTLLIM